MLTFYINRAGANLGAGQRRVLQQAKEELSSRVWPRIQGTLDQTRETGLDAPEDAIALIVQRRASVGRASVRLCGRLQRDRVPLWCVPLSAPRRSAGWPTDAARWRAPVSPRTDATRQHVPRA